MTSLSVDREREHAKPRECVARAICNATRPVPAMGGIDAWDLLNDWAKHDRDAQLDRDEFLNAGEPVLKALISHGWITIDGLEAMKKERGME